MIVLIVSIRDRMAECAQLGAGETIIKPVGFHHRSR